MRCSGELALKSGEDLQSRICSFWELHPVVNATSGDQTPGSRQCGQPAHASACLPAGLACCGAGGNLWVTRSLLEAHTCLHKR